MKEIKYLAKFVSEESFANDLICGNLFMRPVWYFRELEKKNRIAGQGDMREGAVFVEEKENQHYYMECFENSDVPIFCTYIIYDEDILDGRVYIPQKVITDFHCQDGYVVLIDYLPFQDALKTLGRRFSYCGCCTVHPTLCFLPEDTEEFAEKEKSLPCKGRWRISAGGVVPRRSNPSVRLR